MPRDVACRFMDEISTGSKILAGSSQGTGSCQGRRRAGRFRVRGFQLAGYPFTYGSCPLCNPILLSPKNDADQVIPS